MSVFLKLLNFQVYSITNHKTQGNYYVSVCGICVPVLTLSTTSENLFIITNIIIYCQTILACVQPTTAYRNKLKPAKINNH